MAGEPTLQQGSDQEDWVRYLQEMLVEYGYDLGEDGTSGRFGSSTDAAVRQFQESNVDAYGRQLEADGSVEREDVELHHPGRRDRGREPTHRRCSGPGGTERGDRRLRPPDCLVRRRRRGRRATVRLRPTRRPCQPADRQHVLGSVLRDVARHHRGGRDLAGRRRRRRRSRRTGDDRDREQPRVADAGWSVPGPRRLVRHDEERWADHGRHPSALHRARRHSVGRHHRQHGVPCLRPGPERVVDDVRLGQRAAYEIDADSGANLLQR